MPTLDELRLKTGQLIVENWYDDLVDFLEQVETDGAVDFYGYVHKDLIPVADLLINLGLSLARFKSIHVETVYYRNLVFE